MKLGLGKLTMSVQELTSVLLIDITAMYTCDFTKHP